MNHLTDEEMTDAYYAGIRPEWRQHFAECEECRSGFDRIRDLLDSVREYPVPERGGSYGAEVWARLAPRLPIRKPRLFWLQWWTIAPAVATLLAVTFFAGMMTQERRQPGIPAKARERVLLIAMSDHLERSQIVLAQLINAAPGNLDWTGERERARDLIAENRLLRQTALHSGDEPDAALLEDLERVLLDVANSPADLRPDELENLQQRIENEELLFKVRITSADARQKGQKL